MMFTNYNVGCSQVLILQCARIIVICILAIYSDENNVLGENIAGPEKKNADVSEETKHLVAYHGGLR